MSKPIVHARNAVKKFGHPEAFDAYLAVHELFDTSKALVADARHRALFHSHEGIILAEMVLRDEVSLPEGVTFKTLGEQHVEEDLGYIPFAQEYVGQVLSEDAGLGELKNRPEPSVHALADAAKWGGDHESYLPVHGLIDYNPWFMMHNAYGPFLAQRRFGHTIKNSRGRDVCVRDIAEDHIKRECNGKIPSFQDLLSEVKVEAWMTGVKKMKIEIVD